MPTKIQGVIAYRKALRQFEPELAKETTKEITAFLKPVVKDARGYLPSNAEAPSGWLRRPNAKGRWANRFYDATIARRSISYKTSPSKANRSGFRALASIFNKSAAGAIYETAGRKTRGQQGNSTNPQAGQQFIEGLGGTRNIKNAEDYKGKGRHSLKQRGRAMFRAVAEDQGKARTAVMRALEKAEANFNRRTM